MTRHTTDLYIVSAITDSIEKIRFVKYNLSDVEQTTCVKKFDSELTKAMDILTTSLFEYIKNNGI